MPPALQKIRDALVIQGKALTPTELKSVETSRVVMRGDLLQAAGVSIEDLHPEIRKQVAGERVEIQRKQYVELDSDTIVEAATPHVKDKIAAALWLGSKRAGPGIKVNVQVSDILHLMELDKESEK